MVNPGDVGQQPTLVVRHLANISGGVVTNDPEARATTKTVVARRRAIRQLDPHAGQVVELLAALDVVIRLTNLAVVAEDPLLNTLQRSLPQHLHKRAIRLNDTLLHRKVLAVTNRLNTGIELGILSKDPLLLEPVSSVRGINEFGVALPALRVLVRTVNALLTLLLLLQPLRGGLVKKPRLLTH